jgi:hypothetical protein
LFARPCSQHCSSTHNWTDLLYKAVTRDSTSPPSNGSGTRARSSTAAAHCEQPAPLKSSRNAATLAATAVACAACDPQLVRTPTNCDQLNYLAVNYILDTTARCQRDHRRGEVLHPPCIVGGRSSRTERNNQTRPSLTIWDKIRPTLFPAESDFSLYTLKQGPNRPALGPVAASVATHISRPYEPKIAWGLRMPTPK